MSTDASATALAALFALVGIEESKCLETTRNKRLSAAFKEVICEAGLDNTGCDKSIGVLLYYLASTGTSPKALHGRKYLAGRIVAGDLKTDAQVKEAIRYFEALADGQAVDEAAFDQACGVNVHVAREDIVAAVKEAVKTHKTGLEAERYGYNSGLILKMVRDMPSLRWADRKTMKDLVDVEVAAFLGPKVAEDGKERKKEKEKAVLESNSVRVFEGKVLRFHKPGENPQLTPELTKKHLEATGGRIVTRFPPEPNGFLHIGHAKAMNINFKYAEANGGVTYLRFDDTNPEAEEPRYYDAIRKNVAWLGYKPYKETCASDYFQQLYEYAVQLIRDNKAYVCHQTSEEIHLSRGGDEKGPRTESPWRNRPVQESLCEFERMRAGEYKEGEATLRLKMDVSSDNPRMWDLVAYRVLYTRHCRTGRTWNIYPMYDFTHCLCDSIENITHSLCTTEFISAREAYYWVCDSLQVYKPIQWEYGRLNITHTVLSKRKLQRLVAEGHVASWDDPRLYTLAAVRRRGFTPAAINTFVERLGVTTAPSTIDVKLLEACVRDDLNKTALRRMVVLDPVAVRITNMDDGIVETVSLPNDPRNPAKGESSLPFSNRFFIDAGDFRHGKEADDPNYFRLAPNKTVGIYRVGVITCTGFKADDSGRVLEIEAILDRTEAAARPKTFITWVPASPITAQVRIYSELFKSADPLSLGDAWLSDIRTDSLQVIPEAYVDPRLKDARPGDTFQFQRVGYFCCDPDSTSEKLVFNLTVSIKEDPHKS